MSTEPLPPPRSIPGAGEHVFLSHNSRDKPAVEILAYALLDRGIRPWLDKWDLTPGRSWQTEIEQALAAAGSVLVCVGPHGLGRVQQPELQAALDRAWSDESKTVIPVLLPQASATPELPRLLAQRTWIDLRSGWKETELDRLVAALEGRSAGIPASSVAACPYPGLQSFEEHDAGRYFGREQEVSALLDRLRSGQRLQTLVGASGAGKSSLLLAGLLPALRTGELDGSYDWQVLAMRPGPRPIHELAVRLVQLAGGGLDQLASLKRALDTSSAALSDRVDLLLAGEPGSPRLALAVDQFEEIFTQLEDSDEGCAFVANLLHAAAVAAGRVIVLLTLRADFLGLALEHSRALAEAIRDSQELVLPMTPAALRAAIERPAWQARAVFDDGLVDTLVREVEGQPGYLPLLQFTLEDLWRRGNGRRLSWDAYRELGGLRGAIAQRADTLLATLDDEERAVVRRLFGRLVRLEEGAADTRRRASRESLESLAPGVAGPLLDRWINARLLTARQEGVEVAHEAILRQWATLRRWIDADRAGLQVQQEIAEAARQWQRDGQREEDLWRGGRLERALALQAAEELTLAGSDVEFLDASAATEKRQQEEENKRRSRELGWLRDLSVSREKVGDLLVQQGDLAGALTEYRASLDTRKHLTIQSPESMNRLRDLSVSQEKIGDVLLQQGDLAAALEEYRASHDIRKRLYEQDSENAGWRRDLSVNHNKIGDVLVLQGDLPGALSKYRASHDIVRDLCRQDPGNTVWLHDLSSSHNKIGDVLRQQGDLAGAQEEYRASHDIVRRLSEEDPENLGWLRDLSVNHNKIGDVLLQQTDTAGAHSEYRASTDIARRLCEQDPENTGWLRDHSVSREKLGDVLLKQGDVAAALVEYRASHEIARRLSELDPRNVGWRRDLSISYNKIGDILKQQGDLAVALMEYRASCDIRRRLTEQAPENTSWFRDLSISHNKIGDVLKDQGNFVEALAAYRASYDIRRQLSEQDPENAGWQIDVASSCWRLFDTADTTMAGGRAEAIERLEEGLGILRRLDAADRLPPYWQEWIPKYQAAIAEWTD